MPQGPKQRRATSAQKRAAARAEEAGAWTGDYHDFLRARLTRVQTAAQGWLGVLTTMLSLVSIVVLLNKGAALGDLPISNAGRIALYLLVFVVFMLAFSAVLYGAVATFSGIGLATPDEVAEKKVSRSGLMHRMRVEWTPREVALDWNRDWRDYHDRQEERANTLRTYLHRSRILGIAAAFLVGVLALIVLLVGTFNSPASQLDVLVVNHGRLYCGAVATDSKGLVSVAGSPVTHATRVVVVNGC